MHLKPEQKDDRTDNLDWGSMLVSRRYIRMVQLIYYHEQICPVRF